MNSFILCYCPNYVDDNIVFIIIQLFLLIIPPPLNIISYTNAADKKITSSTKKIICLVFIIMNLMVCLLIPYLYPLTLERLIPVRTNNKISRIIVILTQPTLSLVNNLKYVDDFKV